ncbi:MAG TPA: extracellular solute-binding protein [Ruminiclostridium sp.]
MKKNISLFLAVALIATSMVGCGSKATPEASTTAASSTTTVAAASTAVVPAKEANLRYLTWEYSESQGATDAWIKNSQDKFNITIDMQNAPGDTYNNVLKTQIASNDIPDLVRVHTITNDMLLEGSTKIDTEMFADISDLKAVADYDPASINNNKRGDKLYYVSMVRNALGGIYNKKVFKDLNLQLPTNYDEFIAVCEKIKAANIAPIAGSFKEAWTIQIIPFIAFGQYIESKDPDIKNKLKTGTTTYADHAADVKKALDLTQIFIDKGYVSKNYLGTDTTVACSMVGTGKAAMLINGTWMFKQVQDSNPSAEIGFMAIPFNAAGEKTTLGTSSDNGICISSATKEMEAARTALEYYLGTDIQTILMNDLNGIPTNSKVTVDSPSFKEISKVLTLPSVQVLGEFWDGNYFPGSVVLDMGKDFQNLLAKGTTSDEIVKKYTDLCAKALEAKK